MSLTLSKTPLILALAGLGICSGLQAGVSVEPTTVAVGKASQVTLTFDQPEAVSSVSIQPGSPYLKQTLSLSGSNQNGYQIIRRHNGLYVRDADNRMVAYFANERGSAASGHYHFAAAGDAGIQIFKEHDWARKSPSATFQTSDAALDIASADGLAFVASGNGGLTVLDVDNPEQPLWLGSHQKLGYSIKLYVDGRRVAVLNDAGVVYLIDASNPVEPTTISSFRSDTAILDIALHNNQLFALTQNQIQVIDFSPETPQLSNEGLDFGQGVNLGGERRVFIDNDIAYVADWFSGIHIYDLSRPRQPQLLSSFHTPGSPKGIVVRDGVAFVADDDHGLQIVDVSDPINPKQVSNLLTQGLAYTPRLVGDLLYLASHRGGFQIIDVSDVTDPKLVSEFDTDGKAWSMEVHDNIAYVADDDSGLLMFDVSDPAKPGLIGQHFTGGAAEEVTVRGNIVFVAFFDDGLQILDIGDPRQPKLISRLNLPGNARGLDLIDNRLYVAGWLAGVHVVDVSDLKQPKLLGSHDTRGATWGLKVVNELLYAMDWWGGVSVIDISDPARPQAVGGYHNRGHVHDIKAQDNYTFVAHGSNGLQVFDIKNPLNPTWTTGVSFPGQARQLVLNGKRAYVAAGDGGLAKVDISNPFQLRWLGSVNTRGEVSHVAADEYYIFLNDSREGLIALNKQADQTPRLARLDVQVNDMWLYDGLLYLATVQGVEVVRIGQSQQFELVSRFNIDGGAQQINGDSRLIYVGSGNTLLSLRRKLLPELLNQIEIDGHITDIELSDTGLLVSTNKMLFSIDNRNVSQPGIATRYPLLAESTRLTHHQGVVYISGEETITALRPMPMLQQQTQGLAEIEFTLPDNLAIGSYDLNVRYNDGSESLLHNAIRVEMPKFSKPKMSMEDFKKLLQQQQNNSELFTKPPALE